MEIEEVGGPSSRLMLRNGGNDGDVVLGISGVEERVETTGPGSDDTRELAENNSNKADGKTGGDSNAEKALEGVRIEHAADKADKGVKLEETKCSKGKHVLRRLHSSEADEADLHSQNRTENINGAIRDVHTLREATSEEENQNVKRDDVDDENVTSPSGNHVKVRQSASNGPEDGTSANSARPEEESEHQSENGNRFVIERTSNRARNIARNNSHETSSSQSSSGGVMDLLSEEVGGQASQ